MTRLRSFRSDDLEQLYAISLGTGLIGRDASGIHNDPDLIGHIYSAPYAALEPEYTLVAEDDEGVGGFIVGAPDTSAFIKRLEREWWPALRQRYVEPQPPADRWNADQKRIFAIHHPSTTPADIIANYPAHVHMNLLPRMQEIGLGTALLSKWIARVRAAGVAGIHLGANSGNTRGIRFWCTRGFRPIRQEGRTCWFGMQLD